MTGRVKSYSMSLPWPQNYHEPQICTAGVQQVRPLSHLGCLQTGCSGNSLQFHEEGQMSAWILPLLSPKLTIQSGFPTNFRSPHPALTRAAGEHSEAPGWAA